MEQAFHIRDPQQGKDLLPGPAAGGLGQHGQGQVEVRGGAGHVFSLVTAQEGRNRRGQIAAKLIGGIALPGRPPLLPGRAPCVVSRLKGFLIHFPAGHQARNVRIGHGVRVDRDLQGVGREAVSAGPQDSRQQDRRGQHRRDGGDPAQPRGPVVLLLFGRHGRLVDQRAVHLGQRVVELFASHIAIPSCSSFTRRACRSFRIRCAI